MSRTFLQCLLPLSVLLLCMLSPTAFAQSTPNPHDVVSNLLEQFNAFQFPDTILKSANYLFWSLATISLVWTMGMLLLRRGDIGEFFLELVRFIIITGFFSWLLTNASSADPQQGFVNMIINSFVKMGDAMPGNSGLLGPPANNVADIGLRVFNQVMEQSTDWPDGDKLIAGSLAIMILMALTLVAAQLVLVLIMAWLLAYGGIFLLGFGGSRWTSPLAISYYKHVVAVGTALLSLALVIAFGQIFLNSMSVPLTTGGVAVTLEALAAMLMAALLMVVLCIKVPGLLYTMVTGSQLGFLAGTAGMTSTAIVTGGNQAMTGMARQSEQSRTVHVEGRRDNVMEAFGNVSATLYNNETVYQPVDFADYGRQASAAGSDRTGPSTRGSVFGNGNSQEAWIHKSPQAQRAQEHPAPNAQGNTHANVGKSSSANAAEDKKGTAPLLQSANEEDRSLPQGTDDLSALYTANAEQSQLTDHSADLSNAAQMASLLPQSDEASSAAVTKGITESASSLGHTMQAMSGEPSNIGSATSDVSRATSSMSNASAGSAKSTAPDRASAPYGISQSGANPYGIGQTTSVSPGSNQTMHSSSLPQSAGSMPSSPAVAGGSSSTGTGGVSHGGFQPAVLSASSGQSAPASMVLNSTGLSSSAAPSMASETPSPKPVVAQANPSDEIAAFRDRKSPFDVSRHDK